MQLIGLARLGRDAELRHTSGGDAVTNLSLAFNYGRKDDTGKRPSQWVEGVLWGKLAEALVSYLVKGQQVCATLDDVHTEEYDGRNGKATKLIGRVTSIQLAGQAASDGSARQAQRSPAPAPAPRPAPAKQSGTGFDDMDDDIPF